MERARTWRRTRVVVSLAGTALALAGAAACPPSGAASVSRAREHAGQPLIVLRQRDFRAFSPNGDHRVDRLRTTFVLDEAARVTVRVRDDGKLVRGPVRLGRLAAGPHAWRWDGRDNRGAVVADGYLEETFSAVAGPRTRSATTTVRVDTAPPSGQLRTSRPTAYPVATAVEDHVLLTWVLDGWNPFDEEQFPEEDRPARTELTIRSAAGATVWHRARRDQYTPVFDWYARNDKGAALPAGRYLARATAVDAAGNRARGSRDVWVSHAQLVEDVWTRTMAAGSAEHYGPYFGGCNGCGESAHPVPSERFPGGLSFRPPTEYWQWGTADYFAQDVPFVEAPVDSYRVTAVGGPTIPGSLDHGRLSGIDTGPGDSTVTTPWLPVRLAGAPFLPEGAAPMTWDFQTTEDNSYDVATFTVDYRHYVPLSGLMDSR